MPPGWRRNGRHGCRRYCHSMRMRRIAAGLLFLAAWQLYAATYPPQYRWRTVTTDHFYIHFHQGGETLAQRAAMLAENAHARLTPMIGWTPGERTHVILT